MADPSLMYQWLRPGVVPPTQGPAAGGALPPASSVPPDPTTGAGLGVPGMWSEQPPTNLPMRGGGGLLGRLFPHMPGATGTGASPNMANMTSPAGLGAIGLAGLAGGLRGAQGQQQPPGPATISGGGPLRPLPTLPTPPQVGHPYAGSFQQGGIVPQTGLYQVQGGEQVIPRTKVAKLHKGEMVLPRPQYLGSYQQGGPIYDPGMSSPDVQNQPGATSMYNLGQGQMSPQQKMLLAMRQFGYNPQQRGGGGGAPPGGVVAQGGPGPTPQTGTVPFVGDPLNYPKVPQAIMPTGAEKGPGQYAQPFSPNTETQFVNKAARAQAITSNLIGGIGQAVMTYKQMEWDKKMQQARAAGLQQAQQQQQQGQQQQPGQPGEQQAQQPDKSLQYLQAAMQAAPTPKAKQDIQKQIDKYQKDKVRQEIKQNKQMAKVWENAQKPNSPEWFGMQQARQDLYAQQLTQANIQEAQLKAQMQAEQLKQMQDSIQIIDPITRTPILLPKSMAPKVLGPMFSAEGKKYGVDKVNQERLAAQGYQLNEQTGQLEVLPEDKLPEEMQTKIRLQKAQTDLANAREDVLMNPNNPTFKQKALEAQARLNLAKVGLSIREQSLDLRKGVNAEKIYQPAMLADVRLLRMRENMRDALSNPTNQQAMLAILYDHIGMTLGEVKGARPNRAAVEEAEKSGNFTGRLAARFDKEGYVTGVVLTPQQMQQMVALGESRRPQMWQMARDQARTFNLGLTEPDPIPGLDRVPDVTTAPLAPLPGLTTPYRGQALPATPPPGSAAKGKRADPLGLR